MAEEQKFDQENGEKMEENNDNNEEEPTANRNLFNLDEFEDSETASSGFWINLRILKDINYGVF